MRDGTRWVWQVSQRLADSVRSWSGRTVGALRGSSFMSGARRTSTSVDARTRSLLLKFTGSDRAALPAPQTAEVFDADIAQAWVELRTHPALSWVPPMWRSAFPTTDPYRHAVSAVDRNLSVEIVTGGSCAFEVRLATGPLKDRRVGDGLDPLTPVASVSPDLTVSAPSFEEAVLELRDAVVKAYGPVNPLPREMTGPVGGRHPWMEAEPAEHEQGSTARRLRSAR